MSLEQLLFLILLVAIPLLERVFRLMRARTLGTPLERAPGLAETSVSRPNAPARVADTGAMAPERPGPEPPPAGPPLLPGLPPVLQRTARTPLPSFQRSPDLRRARTEVKTPSVGARHPDRSPAAQRSIARADMRRAIVLVAILGPCRALGPHDTAPPG